MTVDLSRVRAQVAAVEGDLEPGDHIVAGTLGETGRVPWWEAPATYLAYATWACAVLAGAALFIAGKQPQETAVVSVCVVPCCLVSLFAPRRTPTYIVVTMSRVYLIPFATGRRGRACAITKTLVGCVRIRKDRSGRFRRVIQLEGPALPLRGLQFLVIGAWRADLDGVLVAIRTGRAAPGPDPRAAASRPDRDPLAAASQDPRW